MENNPATILEATFDGQFFRPDSPVALPPNTRVRLSIETLAPKEAPASFLKTARSLNLQGPADWSARLHDYHFGEDKPALE
jgi:hypothetical protein